MKKTILLTLILVVLLPYSCIKITEKENYPIIYVDLEEKKPVSLSDLFSHIKIIPLETNEKSLIKDIIKTQIYENNIYVFDYRSAEVLWFDTNGNFLNKISDRGQGPQEYLNISDFEVDETNKKILLLAPVNNSMYEYDLNGVFIGKYRLPEIKGAYNSFKSINNDTIAFFTFDYDNRIKFYSKKKNQIIQELLPERGNILNSCSSIEFPYSNYLHRASSSILYLIENDCSIRNGYAWDFGMLNNTKRQIKNIEKLPDSEIQNYFPEIFNSAIINQVIPIHGGNSKYLFCQVWRNGKRINIFHEKMDKKNYIFEKTIEDVTFHPLLWHENYVLGYYSEEWGGIDETIPDKLLDTSDLNIKNNYTDDNNPILIKYYFNK